MYLSDIFYFNQIVFCGKSTVWHYQKELVLSLTFPGLGKCQKASKYYCRKCKSFI